MTSTSSLSKNFFLAVALLFILGPAADASALCGATGISLQVLGSGGPEITDQRASSGYLIWRDGHARVLIDMGPGSMLRFEESGAKLEDIDVILLSHLHVDHSADLPALLKGSFFTDRDRDLPVFGPTGNQLMPTTEAFVRTLFASPDGAFHYLDDYLTGGESFRLRAFDVNANGREPTTVIGDERFRLTAVPVHHGPIPALAWRIDIDGKSIVISGDMNGDNHTLEGLAEDADLLVAHHAIPEGATGVARNLHMPPSVIGEIAAAAHVKRLVLSHRMLRTIGEEAASEHAIGKFFEGQPVFAEDGQCFAVQ